MRLERRPPGMCLSRIARRTLSVVALCSAASMWSAPTALADVTDVTVLPGLSNGPASYGSGCTYLVVARTSTPIERSVSIVDYNRASTFFPQELIWDTIDPYYNSPVILGHAFSLWTSTAPGEHTLMAYQTSAGGPVETVTVTPGTPIGRQ
ncbi:hypothetical protein [Rhodococcus oxybenzonivorans]|nr:hypothetical protein [Rhodococcus oxybenzonivorans]MDV7347686.1 hypothetical protein [Rhodococcus oxybenzonivorans]